jgi:hypothetical protein
MAETKPVLLTLISAHGQGRMAETKPVWLSQISTYGQGRMGDCYLKNTNVYFYYICADWFTDEK